MIGLESPVQTRGDRVAVAVGFGLLAVLFVLEVAVGWGLNRTPVWMATGLVVGVVMLAVAALVDRREE